MERTLYLNLIEQHLRIQPVCAILGARQVGKTTLAREFAKKHPEKKVEFFDLENPIHLASLETPMLTLSKYADHLVVIDEIQRRPDLFPILRVLIDDPACTYMFLILGSASRDLLRQSSETLAGRIGYIELPPFTLSDVRDADKLLMRGGFPRSYLAHSNEDSFLWRDGYINTFLERDLPGFGFDVPPRMMHRFWMMLCFYHGQLFNAHEIALSLMLSDKTVTKYLDILAGTFMIRVLQPWFENIKKRQIKTPKIYFRDTGIFNALSSIRSITELAKTPKIGPVWEGFALEEVINCLQIRSNDCYFWSTHNEAELDLLAFKNGKRLGFEFKYTESPKITKSMNIALEDLKLDHLYVVFPGSMSFDLSDKITACGLDVLQDIKV
ncbi:ATP-binding protein [Candidatus Dependentiae bacterium]|nr:ATP-binding protein [Candidatus Dependentiae bacterium]MCC7414585.1 ATP-binding protein [Campylobacterota bacterium]